MGWSFDLKLKVCCNGCLDTYKFLLFEFLSFGSGSLQRCVCVRLMLLGFRLYTKSCIARLFSLPNAGTLVVYHVYSVKAN